MKHVTQIFSRKALSIICALAIMLSCVSVGFSALAETPSAAAQYIVDADKSPAIPMFAGTKIDLNNVSVLFKGDEAAIAGADITWTLGGDYGQNLILGEDKTLTAFTKGNDYKITAKADEREAVLWVVVANFGDDAWNIYSIDFDAYTEQYSGLTFERDAAITPDTTSTKKNFTYYSGVWKYNGVEFDSSNIPDAIKLPTDWHSTVRGSAGGVQVQVPHVMPLTINALDNEPVVERSGIMPFTNPYLNDGLNTIDSYGKKIWGSRTDNGTSRNDSRSMFYISNDKIDSFSDYTVTADFHVFNMFWNEAYPAAIRSVGIIGRIPVDANHIPTDAAIANYNIDYYSSGSIINSAGKNISFKHQYYGVNIGYNTNYVGQYTVQNNNDQTIYVLPYDADNNAAKRDSWRYLNSNGAKNASDTSPLAVEGTRLVLGVKYAGSNATVFSPADVNNDTFTFNNAVPTKGGVGIYLPNINRPKTNSVADWINVHQFKIALNNNITAENDGSEYPVYEKYYFQPVVDANAEDGAVNAEKNEITFTTISAAIDYLDGEGGKVWVKGDFSVDTSALEGTITPRKAITIAGYGDDAKAASITITSGEYNAWMKGDITFDDITFSQDGTNTWRGLHSNGYVLTFESGVVTSGNEYFATESNTNDQNLVIKGGTFHSFYTKSGNISYQTDLKANTNIELDGGYIKSVYTGTKTNFTRSMNFIGDFNLTVKSGRIDNFHFYGMAYRTLSAYAGDSIINVNGGTVSKIRFGGTTTDAYTAAGLTVTTGNSVAIVDESKLTSGCQVLVYDTKTHYNPASGKKWIAIFNNAGANDYATWGDNASFLDYRIETYAGKTTPVFEREEGKPETSTLVGFTIESNENSAAVFPMINGQKIAPIEGKTTADGEAIYDLSAFEDTLITISFGDERILVVSTDENFTPDVNVYKKVASMSDAIAMLGAEGGTIYVQGTYDFSEFANESNRVSYPAIFAGTANITNGSLAIKGYTDANTNGTDNTLFFLRGVWDGALADDAFKCDVLFDDITIAGSDIGEAGFSILGHTLTLGENLVMAEDASIRISKHLGKSSSIVDANIVINGGKYSFISSYDGNVGNNGIVHNRNYNVTLNGGTVGNIYVLGNTNYKANNKILNGDINYTINGGTINNYLSVSGAAQGCKNTIVNGNVTFRVNGGYIKKYIDLAYGVISTDDYKTENVSLNGNFAAIVNCETLTNSLIFTGADSFKNINLADYTKAIFIANNYDKMEKSVNTNTANINEATGVAYFDYNLKVFGGAAEPVYNDDRSLKGFAITPADGNEDKLLVVNGTDIIEAVGGVYDLSDFEDIGWAEISFKAADELEDTKEVVTDSSVIADYINGLVPVKEGYLFGGFIGENGNALKADEIANAESLTVKFIPKAVLDVKWQVRNGEAANTVDLRLITTLDSTQYKIVTFKVAFDGKEMTVTSRMAYKTIEENVGGVTYVRTASEVNSAASEYVVTHVLLGIPEAKYSTQFVVTAMYETLDGKVIEGDATTIVIDNARTAQ